MSFRNIVKKLMSFRKKQKKVSKSKPNGTNKILNAKKKILRTNNRLYKNDTLNRSDFKSQHDFKLSDKIQSILTQHKNFFKLRPITPISTRGLESRENILEQQKNSLENNQISQILTSTNNFEKNCLNKKTESCNLHKSIKPLNFCVDCFFANYFSPEFQTNVEHQNFVSKFKEASFPSFEHPQFDYYINGTNVPLFNNSNKNLEIVYSCKKHIHSPPRDKPCSDCFWINYSYH